ncbi:MAG: long-chain fatty acid--CoA ligase [Intrasporangiaceae bacterium]|nr:long-chain fatty acid--CoA ligase [Intrasporangiaceae bacterium]
MRNAGLGSWPTRRRIKSAGRPALVAGGQTITHDQLADRVDRVANYLRGKGIGRGDRVAYLGENHPAYLQTLFAAGLLGAVFVPINTRLAVPEVQYILRDCGARLLVHAEELSHLAVGGAEGSAVEARVVVGDGGEAESFEDGIAAADSAHIDEPVVLEGPALILYTSGTTGRPKGAVLTHGNITWNCMNVLVDYDLPSDSVALMISPLFHVASLTMGTLPVLLKGGCVVLETKFDPGLALDLIEKHGITMLSGVPTTFQMMADHPRWDSTDLSSLQTLTCGGSAITRRLVDAYQDRGLAFTCGYGMTETSPGATSLPARFGPERVGSSGLPHFFSDLRVVDADGQDVQPGAVGEILAQGPNVMAGYWNRPEATEQALTDDGWFRSGDMGYRDEDGFLFITDRLKDMIISGGENVYPAEIEAVILELPEVDTVAVVGIPDERWGEVPKAFVRPRPGATIDVDTIANHLSGRLARYKIPRTIEMIAEMPTTASGKIRKDQLRAIPTQGETS